MEAEFGITEAAFGAARGQQTGDETLLVKFYNKPIQDKGKSDEAGRPIFVEKVYIDIRQPGNRTSGVARPIRDTDKQRFPEHYRKFVARQDQDTHEGTPLSEWPGLTRGQVEEMKFFNVFTVEQLASVADSNASNFRGLAQLKQKAAAFLKLAENNAAATALAASEAKNAELEAKIEALMERMDAMDSPKPRKKRRTKAEMEAGKHINMEAVANLGVQQE